MARQVVRNPETGKYQIFSSVVVAFVFDEEKSREELIRYYRDRKGTYSVKSLLHILEDVDNGYYGSGMTYPQAKMWNDHSMGHKYGAQASKDSPSLISCSICRSILREDKKE